MTTLEDCYSNEYIYSCLCDPSSPNGGHSLEVHLSRLFFAVRERGKQFSYKNSCFNFEVTRRILFGDVVFELSTFTTSYKNGVSMWVRKK